MQAYRDFPSPRDAARLLGRELQCSKFLEVSRKGLASLVGQIAGKRNKSMSKPLALLGQF